MWINLMIFFTFRFYIIHIYFNNIIIFIWRCYNSSRNNCISWLKKLVHFFFLYITLLSIVNIYKHVNPLVFITDNTPDNIIKIVWIHYVAESREWWSNVGMSEGGINLLGRSTPGMFMKSSYQLKYKVNTW